MKPRSLVADDLPALASMASALQDRPESHVVYLGTSAPGILSELEASTWDQVGVVALSGDAGGPGDIDGWLIGDVDPTVGRVWWLGPFVAEDDVGLSAEAWAQRADRLYLAARDRLPSEITEEEFAVDESFGRLIDWSRTHGFEAGVASDVLDLDESVAAELADPGVPCRSVTDADAAAVTALHEALFPGTHTTGAQLVDGRDDDHRRLVADVDGRLTGYIAVEKQPDGSGYIDYLGVDPAHRRRGLGAELVRAGVAELRRMDVDGIGLTVRADALGARELYQSLGFRLERTVVPLRLGFGLDEVSA